MKRLSIFGYKVLIMNIQSKYQIAEKIMDTEDDDLLLQIKSLLDGEATLAVSPQHIFIVQEEIAEYRKNPQEGFTKEEALNFLRSRLK